MCMKRQIFIENREGFVGFVRIKCVRKDGAFCAAITPPPKFPRLKFRAVNLNGGKIWPPQGIQTFTENNWMRRLFYFFNAPRRWTRSV